MVLRIFRKGPGGVLFEDFGQRVWVVVCVCETVYA